MRSSCAPASLLLRDGATGADDAKLSSSESLPTKPSDSSSSSSDHAAFLGAGLALGLGLAAAFAFGGALGAGAGFGAGFGFGACGLTGESTRGYKVKFPRRSMPPS